MELKEYLNIIKKDLKLFILVILLVVATTFSYFLLRPVSYGTSLALNISRIGVQETQEFRYDDFYRLQADEKFAETLVEWLKDPRIVSDIYKTAGIDTSAFTIKQLSKSLAPEKLSSQLISVSFSSPDQKTAERVSSSITDVISQNTQDLNKDQKENTWFEIVPKSPVIVKNSFSVPIVFIISLLAGIFLAFWIVLFKHYLS